MDEPNAPPFLPPHMLQAIGNLAAYWAYLESAVEIAIWTLLGVPRSKGAAITTHMGIVSRCDALRTLVSSEFSDNQALIDEINNLVSRIGTARIMRNNIVHAFWKHTPEGQEAAALKISARGKFKQTSVSYSLEDIVASTNTTFDLTSEIHAFLEVVFPDEKFPWPHTSGE
ncbi:hypothetical protein [Parvibaculum sp.]|uniref:hypothetical protein n=1 Tax=Parvibaculum sp. TaxID=2024848 RepID=UPI001D20F1C4|nr:hypothetical protein [Parvibaculum sp.]MBX3488291.1 hypothetical protein [Parvibaculum sp.]MCW5727731.1 hypothetical protein [Parvibaculum sp.]